MWWLVAGPMLVPVRVLAIIAESRAVRRLQARRADALARAQALHEIEQAAVERSERHRRTRGAHASTSAGRGTAYHHR